MAEKAKNESWIERGGRAYTAFNIGAIAVESVIALAVPAAAPAMVALIGFNVLQITATEVVRRFARGNRKPALQPA